MKKIISLLLCVVSLFVFASCGEKDLLSEIKKEGKIVVVTSPDYPAFEFVDSTKTGQDKYVGSDIELMKYIAKYLGVELVIETTDFDTTLTLLSTSVADLAISGYTYKEDRAANYEMSKAYYQEGVQGLIITKENYDLGLYNTFEKLNKDSVKIGAQSGTLQYDYVVNQLEKSVCEKFQKVPEGLLLLDNNTINAIAIASSVANNILSQQPGKYVFLEETFEVPTEETQLFILAKKGQTKLIEEINKIIDEIIEKKLYEEWNQAAAELAVEIGQLE